MKGEALSVVQQEQGGAFFCSLMDGAHAEFVTDAVSGAHEFGSGGVFELVGSAGYFCAGSCMDFF